jgi:atlastin
MGGQRLLENRLAITEKQHEEMKRIRTEIQRSFEKLECFLMPHPGHTVAEGSPGFDGQLSGSQTRFFRLN